MDNFLEKTIKGYQIHEKIGEGGFARIYRATQQGIGREVAIKIILPEYANHPDFIRRFEYEAQLVARLEHPHIVPLHDYWRDSEGAYLVLRWLRGGSLHEALSQQKVTLEQAARIVEQIGDALSFAHRHGIVHRDLKPGNILFDEDGNAYLADFGIAKEILEQSSTEENMTVGSPAYISPEQIRGEDVTPQSDIYSFGVILYEMLSGKPPFSNLTTTQMISRHLNEHLPMVHEVRPDISPAVDTVIARATAKKPVERYRDVAALVADFRKAMPQLERDATGEMPIVVVEEEVGAVSNPYKGLKAFQEADAEDFYGREVLIEQLLSRMREDEPYHHFLAVVGPSGSGKSSVVKAGLLPLIRQGALPGSENWFISEIIPGAHPFEELEGALTRIATEPPGTILRELRADPSGLINVVHRLLPGEDTHLLLVMDQFEEVFTFVEQEERRNLLLKSVLTAMERPDSRLHIIITLRADFYDRPLLYPEFGDMLRRRTEIVLPLLPDEMRIAIEEPARHANLRLEHGLATAIINDVGEQPGTLPLLQYALTELYERRMGRTLTLEGYEESGGVMGALARRADELYQALPAPAKPAIRQLFLRLVTLGEGTEDTRRRVPLTELHSTGGEWAMLEGVMDTYARYRLLTFDRDPITHSPTIEVAHEALIRSWQRLRDWLDENREALRLQRRLTAAATEWIQNGKHSSYLARGVRLAQLESWSQTANLALNETEAEYLAASIEQRRIEEAKEQERVEHEIALAHRARNFLLAIVGILVIATVAGLALAGFAVNAREEAQDNAATATVAQGVAIVEADNAERSAAEARNQALISKAQLEVNSGNTQLALPFAIAANQNPSPLSLRVLYEAIYAPGIRRRLVGHTNLVQATAFSPDGNQVVSASGDKTLRVWNTNTGELLHVLEGHTDWIRSTAFSPDGTAILSASDDMTLILWNVEDGTIRQQFEGHEGEVVSAAFSPDGQRIISGSNDGTLILWDASTGEIIRQFEDTSEVKSVAYSPDGQRVASGNLDGIITLWDVESGAASRTLEGHSNTVWGLAFSPNGQNLLSGSEDRTLIFWNIEAGNPIYTLAEHSDAVLAVAISPDGTRAVSVSEDTKVIIWDLQTGRLLRELLGHNGKVYAVAFSPDGRTVASGADDMTVILWDSRSGELERRLPGHTDWVNEAVFSPDGQYALTGSSDSTLRLWNLQTGETVHVLVGHTDPIWAAEFSPDGHYAISGSDDTKIILWNLETGEEVRRFEGHGNWIEALDFSPDGRTFLSGSGDTLIILWDVESGRQIRRFEGHSDAVTAVRFSPDGRTAVSASYDNTLILWDVETAEILRTFEGHTDSVNNVTWMPDGKQILSAGSDNAVILWDVATGEILHRFEHTSPVYDVNITPDGQSAFSFSADGIVIRWNLTTYESIHHFEGHREPLLRGDVSMDGRWMLSGSADGTAILWRIDAPHELMAWGYANRYIRELTCVEREQYQITPFCNEVGQAPTSTPYMPPAPTSTPRPTATANLQRTTATPSPTITLTVTPPPTATPTSVPNMAALGENRGTVPIGDRDAWLYEGTAGEILNIGAYADKPANEFNDQPEERDRRGLLDIMFIVISADGSVLIENDDIADGVTDAEVNGLVLPEGGTYLILVQSFGYETGGDYTLELSTGTATMTPAP